MRKKFAFIGAGSLDFTRDLVRDILSFEAFNDCEISLMDINEKRLEYARAGVERIIRTGGYGAVVTASTDRRKALGNADGVLITILQGGVDVWRHDIEIPMKYGVDICVGDTRGPSGIFRFLRTAPVMLDILRDEFNLTTNPMSMLISYMQAQSGANVTGLCHSVQGTAELLAGWIGADIKDVEYTCAGINHQAFYLEYKVKGEDAYPLIRKAIEREEVANEEPVRIEMFRHLKYFPTESSGHNSEYTPWFRKRPDLIEKYCTHGTGWNPGEHAFILKDYLRLANTWEQEYKDWLSGSEIDLARGEEYASNIFNALFGDHTPYRFNANSKNKGQISNLDIGACVEAPVLASQYGITPLKQVALPQHLAAMVGLSSRIEELAVSAAIDRDPEKVLAAVLLDPLTASVCSMDEIYRMVKEMLEQNAPYLRYFKTLKI
jgi:alpha-galactosidase